MRILLVGAAMATAGGGAWCSGAFSEADVVRVVARPPVEVFEGFHQVLNDYDGGMESVAVSADGDRERGMAGANGTSVVVHEVPGKEIDWAMAKDGQAFLRIDVKFEGVDNGQRTKVIANVELHAVPGVHAPVSGFAAYGFKRMVGKVLDEVAVAIEKGQLNEYAHNLGRNGEGNLPNGYDKYRQREAERRAAAPMVDPNEERLHPTGTEVRPMVDASR